MLGFNRSVEFKKHGAENNKGFSFEDQGDKVFGKVFSPDGVRATNHTRRHVLRCHDHGSPDG
jgi:hypothetical protein